MSDKLTEAGKGLCVPLLGPMTMVLAHHYEALARQEVEEMNLEIAESSGYERGPNGGWRLKGQGDAQTPTGDALRLLGMPVYKMDLPRKYVGIVDWKGKVIFAKVSK